MNFKFLFGFIFLILLVNVSSATTFGHNNSMPDVANILGSNDREGISITVGASDIFVSAVNKPQGTTATKVSIRTTGFVYIANATFVGNRAQFGSIVKLTAGTKYIITLNNTGSAWDENYTNGYAGGYPITPIPSGSGFTWTSSYANGVEVTNLILGLESIDVGDPNVSIVLNSPPNNLITATNNIVFNATATATYFNLTNATLYIWNSSGSIFNKTTNILTGNSTNNTIFNVGGFNADNYKWNVLLCGVNNSNQICNFADSNRSFTWGYNITGQFFNNLTTEGNTEFFQLNLSLGSGLSITSANLIWNYTSYSGNVNNIIGNNYTLSRTLTMPSISQSVNVSVFWNITLSNGFNFLSTNNTQQLLNIGIDNCQSFTTRILNETVRDESTQLILTGATIETAVNIYSNDRSNLIMNISGNYSNPVSFCIGGISSTSIYSMDVTTKYYANQYSTEYYNIRNYNLNVSSTNQNITLFDLSLNDSTEFQLTFTGSDYLPVSGALVYLDRQYIPENTFKTVELPLTDNNGQTVLHMVRNDVVYNIVVVKDGVVLATFRSITAFCEDVQVGNCQIRLNAQDTGQAVFNYNEILGINFNPPSYNNNTNDVGFSFSSFDGSSKNIILQVNRQDIFGNNSICTNTVTSSSGFLSCDIGSIDDTNLEVKIYVDGELIIDNLIFIGDNSYGDVGYFLFFIMSLSVILMFAGSKNTMLVGMLISIIAGISLGLINGNIIGVGASGIWIIVVIIIALWKINKERLS